MSKYCPSCGSEVEEDAKFCEECGTEIDALAATGEDTKEKSNKEKSSTDVSEAESALPEAIINVAEYGVGIVFVLFFLVAVSEGAILSSIAFLIAVLFSIPYSREQIMEETEGDVSQYAIIGIVIVGLIIGVAAFPPVEEDTGTPADGQEDAGGGGSEPASQEETQEDAGGNSGETTSQGGNDEQTEPSGPVIEGEPRDVHGTGDTFTVNNVEYTVTGVRTSSTIGGGFTASEADGVYVIVDMRIKNAGDEPTRISQTPISLVDGQDRSHDTSSDGMFTYEDTIGVLGEEANPGITHEGAVIFDVPPDLQERYLKVSHDPLLGEEETQYVNLDV